MRLLFASLLIFATCYQAKAEEPTPTNQKSANYDKTDSLLPGEEVVTPTGQKMKVWSTNAPVKVSPPPQPFDDPAKTQLPEGMVLEVDPYGQVRPPLQENVPGGSVPPNSPSGRVERRE